MFSFIDCCCIFAVSCRNLPLSNCFQSLHCERSHVYELCAWEKALFGGFWLPFFSQETRLKLDQSKLVFDCKYSSYVNAKQMVLAYKKNYPHWTVVTIMWGRLW